MLDRVPTKPNRYAVYDDAHNFLRYEYHERADEPTQEGSAINKANLLPDNICTLLGIPNTSEIKDALSVIDTVRTIANGRAQIATGSYTGTGTFGISNKNSIALSGTPKFAFITTADDGGADDASCYFAFWCEGVTATNVYYGAGGRSTNAVSSNRTHFSVENNALKWRSSYGAECQLNISGRVYKYIIGY